MSKSIQIIHGTCQQLLFSPKGGIEGALVKLGSRVVQVSVSPDTGAAFALAAAPGKRLRVLAVLDESPKMRDAAHPVYQFESLADADGQAIELPVADPKNTTIKGVVSALHFARHGQANGVVLETGEFIHLRPHGMERVSLKVGSRVHAVGAVRMTQLGTRLLEAHQVNRVALA